MSIQRIQLTMDKSCSIFATDKQLTSIHKSQSDNLIFMMENQPWYRKHNSNTDTRVQCSSEKLKRSTFIFNKQSVTKKLEAAHMKNTKAKYNIPCLIPRNASQSHHIINASICLFYRLIPLMTR